MKSIATVIRGDLDLKTRQMKRVQQEMRRAARLTGEPRRVAEARLSVELSELRESVDTLKEVAAGLDPSDMAEVATDSGGRNIEVRSYVSSTVVASPSDSQTDNGPQVLTGYGAVFYQTGDARTEFRLADRIVERIAPTAFNRALQERQDVLAVFNHDPNWLLGRTANGTCRLFVDATGLRYENDLPNTPQGMNTAESVRRGDLRGSSFRFVVADGGVEWMKDSSGQSIRRLTNLDLVDIGPVSRPAYLGTSAKMRCAPTVREQYEADRVHAAVERARVMMIRYGLGRG